MNGRRMLAIGLALALWAILAVGLSQAQGPDAKAESPQDSAGIKNAVTDDIPVQQWVGAPIPYAGRLSNDAGQPVTGGIYDFSFALYAAETGEELLWSEEHTGVAVNEDGAFSTSLGLVTPITTDMLTGRTLWLTVGVRGPGESDFASLSPRQRVSGADSAALSNSATDQACPHDHFGESWSGSAIDQGLWIHNSGAGDGLQVDAEGASSNGVLIYQAGGVGLQVYQSGKDGVYVYQAGDPTSTSPSDNRNGFEVAGAEGSGLWVGHSGLDGVTVHSADWYGVYVEQSDSDGVRVQSAGGNGVTGISVGATSYGGLFRNDVAGGVGLYAAGGDNTAPDLVLGVYGSGDDGRIYSYPGMTGSDLLLFSNDEAHIHLDEDNNSDSAFVIYNGENTAVFSVNEAGTVTFGNEAGVYGSRATYAVQTTGNWIEDFGASQLVQGQATVTIEPVFAQMVNLDEYHVFLTPLGDCSLYVVDKTPTAFTVRAMGEQQCSIAFDYRLVARQLGSQEAGQELMDAVPEDDD